MRHAVVRLLALTAVSGTVLLATAVAAQATTQPTGRNCRSYYWYDGQGLQHAGDRCAQGRVNYSSYNSVLWTISSYDMYYTVTAGLSYGPHNNENPAKITSGYSSGTQSGLSADSGATNTWISRTYWGTSHTLKGQTVFRMDAYPDIPGAGDPDLDVSTASW
jgi:hypothetical protein